MNLLDGKMVREKIIDDIKNKLIDIDKNLKIVVIDIGESEVNDLYVRQKEKLFNKLGLGFEYVKFSSSASEEEILNVIDKFNIDDTVDGIMVELPVIGNFDVKRIINRIDYRKDVDGLTDINREKLFNNKECIVSSTVEAILEIFEYYNILLSDKKIVIVGNGYLVGNPLSILFRNMDLDAIVCDSKTVDLSNKINKADIVISCVGKKEIIKSEMLVDDQVIIDVGVSVDNDIVCGDIERSGLDNKNVYVTPLIGGVGTVCVATLVKNLIKCHLINNRK